MAIWGIWNKENREFVRHYALHYNEEACAALDNLTEEQFLSGDYDNVIDAAEPREGWKLFKYDNELEAEIDRQALFHGDSKYEAMELTIDESEWVF